MLGLEKFTPANPWRAFFVFSLVTLVTTTFAGPPPSSEPPPLAQVGKPDAKETARILEQFRGAGWRGYVEFDLHALPRRGDETIYHGRLWGGQNEEGAITRIELIDGKGAVHRFLLQNGDHAAVWRMTGGTVTQVEAAAQFEPLIPGVEITAFDLQMPFLYWPQPTVDSVARIRGRPAYEFGFTPPPAWRAKQATLTAVRAYFDAQFSAPIQIEQLAGRQVLKTMSLVDLKKVGEQTIPKSFDIRNDLSRDKTRFEVTAVALNLQFAATVFAPASLADEIHAPPADRIVRLDQ